LTIPSAALFMEPKGRKIKGQRSKVKDGRRICSGRRLQ